MENAKERRKEQRRYGTERRSEINLIYQRLISEDLFFDWRKGQRRKGDRRKSGPCPSRAEEYVIYLVGMEKINGERKKGGLKPLPVLSIEEW